MNIKFLIVNTKLILLFRLIVTFANYHKRSPFFFNKIEQIILIFQVEMKNYFSNREIFNIFKSNKRLLLFLIEKKMMNIDKFIFTEFTKIKYIKYKYHQYFLPELKLFKGENWNPYAFRQYDDNDNDNEEDLIDNDDKVPENFYEERKTGENGSFIAKLIQKDSVEDFISHVNRTNLSLKSKIKLSIYETNSFLLKLNKKRFCEFNDNLLNDDTSLIEYAVFYGSIQIFNYLRLSGVELTPSLWLYAIHGCNGEIIHILEENQIKPKNEKSIGKYLKESIRCHHNDITKYILNNYIKIPEANDKEIENQSIKYYNFNFIKSFNESLFYNLCKYDYCLFVEALLTESKIDVNQKIKQRCDQLKFLYFEDFDGSTVFTVVSGGSYEKTPLFAAVEKENFEIIKLLLNTDDIDVNVINNENDNIWGGNMIMFCELTKKKTALYVAIEKENIEIIKLLLANNNIDVNIPNMEDACTGGGDEKVWKRTALYNAISKNNNEITKLLLQNDKIDVNIPCKEWADWAGGGVRGEGTILKSPLYLSISKMNDEICKILLGYENLNVNFINGNFINVDENDNTINDDNYDIEDNDEIHFFWKATALHSLVYKGSIELIGLLMNHKDVDVNIKNNRGRTPIQCTNDPDIIKLITK